MSGFDPAALALVAEAEEAIVITEAGGGEHRTIIWPVVDEEGRLFLRSVRGPRGRWYREAVAQPEVGLEVGDVRLAARAVPAGDPERVAACSAALRAKYSPGPSLTSMLAPETLETTLELVPR